jgi:hypothetical protein
VAGAAVNCAWAVVTAGGALTVIVALALMLVSLTAAAVTVAVPVAPFAVKVTVKLDVFVNEVGVHAVPLHVHVTPSPPRCCPVAVTLTD